MKVIHITIYNLYYTMITQIINYLKDLINKLEIYNYIDIDDNIISRKRPARK